MTFPVVVDVASKDRTRFGFTRPEMGSIIRISENGSFLYSSDDNWNLFEVKSDDVLARDWQLVELS